MSVCSKRHRSTHNQTPKVLTSPQSAAEWKFARSVKTPTASETAWNPWWKVILLSGTFQETCPVYPHSWSWLSIKKAPSPLVEVLKKKKKKSLNRIPLSSLRRPVFGIGPATFDWWINIFLCYRNHQVYSRWFIISNGKK